MPFQLLCVLKVRRGYEKKTVLLKHSDDIENTIRKQNCKEIVLNTLNKLYIFNICLTVGVPRQWKTSVFIAEMVIIMDILFTV